MSETLKKYPFTAFFGKVDVEFDVPSTVESYDNILGEAGACLDDAVSNVVYRHTAPRLYSAVSDALAKEDGEFKFPKAQATKADGTPEVRVKKDGSETKVMEADTKHLTRFYEQGDDAAKASLLDLIKSTAATLPFYDPREASTPRGSSRINKGHLEAANTFVAQGAEKCERILAHVEATVPGFEGKREEDGSVTPENLARAIAALEKHEAAKVKAATQAAFAALG